MFNRVFDLHHGRWLQSGQRIGGLHYPNVSGTSRRSDRDRDQWRTVPSRTDIEIQDFGDGAYRIWVYYG